ncbi:4'-phosphopantetheinyl transferase superfamily protein [Streptomyces sp. NPDC101118]|uniref:4'-phosphopantetheinyl transferase superfamily protein n=1 Tax=Streptomyces sp. NPDC101118 TaxID=3366109 RepID=UPI0038268558
MLKAPPPEAGPLDLSVLDPAERDRVAAFVRPTDARAYAAAHIALRRLLAGWLRIGPEEIPIWREPLGRPVIPCPGLKLHFSVSHSGGLALFAVAAAPIGADVQRRTGDRTIDAVARTLHPAERAELEAAPEEARPELFGRMWTRKEAYLKGIGTGLRRSPAADYLGSDPRLRPHGWTVFDVSCPPAHTAAVAVQGPAPRQLRVHWLPPDWLA